MKRIISPADAVLSVPEPVSPVLPESQNMNVTLNPVDVVFGSTNRSEVQPSPLVPVTDVRTEAGYTPPKATFFEAMGGQLSELSLYSSIINAVSKDDPVHEAVPDFDAVSTYNNDKDARVFQFSPEDQMALWNTVSPGNYNDVKEAILGRQIAEKAVSENVWGGFAGAVIDADLVLGLGVGKVMQGVGMASKLKHYGTSAVAGATVVGGVSAASGRTGETLAWDVFAGAMGSLVPQAPKMKAMPKVTNTTPTATVTPQGTLTPYADTLDTITTGGFDPALSPVPYAVQRNTAAKVKLTSDETVGVVTRGRIVEGDTVLAAGAASSDMVRKGRVVIPENINVTYIPEDDLILAKKGVLDTAEGQQELLRELGVRAGAVRVLGFDTVSDMIDHVYHLQGADDAVAKAAVDYASTAPDVYRGITALGRYVELKAGDVSDTVIQRLITSIRTWLRERGINIDYSDSDIVTLARKSMRQIPEHKTVPNAGIVYHGSAVRGIPALDLSYAKSGEGNQAFGFGHYVTTDEGLAQQYKANVSSFKGRNPETEGTVYALRRNFTDDVVVDLDSTKQSALVTKAFAKYNIPVGTGSAMYKQLSRKLGGDKEASAALVVEGVLANKYKTGAARQGIGDASNYVVFDNSGLSMLRDLAAPRGTPKVASESGDTLLSSSSVGVQVAEPARVTPNMAPAPVAAAGTIEAAVTSPTTPNIAPTPVEAAEAIQPGFKQYLSSHDKATQYFGEDLANRVLANPKTDVSDSATAWGRDTLLELDTALVPVERAITSSVPGWFSLSRLRGSKADALREETNALTKQARVWLNQAQQAEYRGVPLPAMPADARVQKIINAYTESGFGMTAGTRMQQAGVYGADMIVPSKYYAPVKHSYTKMAQWAGTDAARWNDLYTMYGQQISTIYPNLTKPAVQGGAGLTLQAVGKKFVKTQEAKLTDPKAQAFRGTTKDELEAILIDAGVDRNTLQQILDPLQRKTNDAGKIKPLKKRMDWDYSGLHVTSKGETISINDFMDDDLLGNLNGYARSISGRVGLGRVGYATEADLRADFNAAIQRLPVEARAEANELANNIIAQVTGAPVGERAADWFRTMTSLGALTQLANAGIYGVAEFSRITREFGISTVAKHFIKSFSGAIKGANKMTVKEGMKLQDILSGRLFAEGRLRPYITHLDDNWSGPAHNIHESVSFAAQYTKYINGGEAMRRVLINLNAGIMDELLVNLNKVGSTTSRDYLRSLNVADADIDAIAEQVRLHDTVMDSWDVTVRTKAMNMLTSATDNLTMSVRHGEQPAFVEHSAIGRVMFPYMRYVFGATNKVLRRSYNRNGVTGVALDLVASAPLMVLAAGASNVVNGRDFDDNIAIRSLRASPTLGMVGIVGEGLAMGELGGAIPAYGMANNLFKLSNKAATGDLSIKDVIQSVPGVGIFPGTRLALSAIEDKD